MAKKKSGSPAFESLKRSFESVQKKMRRETRAASDAATRRSIHREWEKLASAHKLLGFGTLENLQDPPFALRRSKKR